MRNGKTEYAYVTACLYLCVREGWRFELVSG